jgi:DegV family protein with EDD domain
MRLMTKIGIITCSSSGVDFIKGYEDIRKGRTTITMDGMEYIDGTELTPETFYERLDTLQSLPKTSQPSIGQLLDIFEDMKGEGYTDAIYISISEHLSGTYQSVCMAKEMIEGIVIHPFNSRTASFVTGFMATEAHRLAKEGKTVEQILSYLEELRDGSRVLFMVDDLKYLVKNGRLSNTSGFIASTLKIKPLLELNKEGKIVACEKIRTTQKAINRVIESFLEETNAGQNTKFIFLFHTQAPTHIEYVKGVLEAHGIDTTHLIDSPVSPAIGCHVGKGVVGIGYIK